MIVMAKINEPETRSKRLKTPTRGRFHPLLAPPLQYLFPARSNDAINFVPCQFRIPLKKELVLYTKRFIIIYIGELLLSLTDFIVDLTSIILREI